MEISIAEDYARRVAERQERLRRGWKIPIRACHPQEGEVVEEIGIVREILPAVNVFKKFDLPPDNLFAIKFLGELAHGNWMQITIHVDNPLDDVLLSYTLLIRTDTWQVSKARLGDLVCFVATGQCIPSRPALWRCKNITLVQPAL